MDVITLISRSLLDDVSAKARTAPRKRMNFNLHSHEQEPCNRLLNAMEPGTFFVPHCHADPSKDETIVMLRGKLGIVVFDVNGNVADTAVLEAGGENIGITITHGVFHAMVVLESGTVMFEAKAGPFQPLQAGKEVPVWAPRPESPEASAYLARLTLLFGRG
ncbi:MAG: WbuC family cupin fold metalloprotein [bacterium]